MTEEKLIKDIKDKIQFLVTVEILYLTLIYGFFKATGANELISNDNASAWAIGVAMSVATYILIEEVRGSNLFFQIIRAFVYASLICLIPLIILTVLVQHSPLPSFYLWIFSMSLSGSLWIPIVTFPVTIIFFFARFFQKVS